MSRYSDKVKRRMDAATAKIREAVLPPAPIEPTAPAAQNAAAVEANAEIVRDICKSLSMANGLLVRAASLAKNWSKCSVSRERFIAIQARDTIRAALNRVSTTFNHVCRSDFAPIGFALNTAQIDEPKHETEKETT